MLHCYCHKSIGLLYSPFMLLHNVCIMQMPQLSFLVSIQGTTGHPKAALSTHHILVNNAMVSGKYMELNAMVLYMYSICVNYSRKATFITSAVHNWKGIVNNWYNKTFINIINPFRGDIFYAFFKSLHLSQNGSFPVTGLTELMRRILLYELIWRDTAGYLWLSPRYLLWEAEENHKKTLVRIANV